MIAIDFWHHSSTVYIPNSTTQIAPTVLDIGLTIGTKKQLIGWRQQDSRTDHRLRLARRIDTGRPTPQ
jgi:hypothetical protein